MKFSDEGLSELARIYMELGIDAAVSTDHARPDRMTQADFQAFVAGHARFREAMATSEVKAYFGAEVFIQGTEYLVYGMYPQEFISLLGQTSYRGFMAAVHAAGAVAVQSHPFRIKRGRMVHMLGMPCDGYEVHNCHPKHQNNNELALMLLARLGGIGTGGSDAHKPSHAGGYIEFKGGPPVDEKALVQVLRDGKFSYP
jgi:histidinol phosphatase-like PHP family hydrolase